MWGGIGLVDGSRTYLIVWLTSVRAAAALCSLPESASVGVQTGTVDDTGSFGKTGRVIDGRGGSGSNGSREESESGDETHGDRFSKHKEYG